MLNLTSFLKKLVLHIPENDPISNRYLPAQSQWRRYGPLLLTLNIYYCFYC